MRQTFKSLFVAAVLVPPVGLQATEVDNVTVESELTYAYGSEIEASIQGELEIEPTVEQPSAKSEDSARDRQLVWVEGFLVLAGQNEGSVVCSRIKRRCCWI